VTSATRPLTWAFTNSYHARVADSPPSTRVWAHRGARRQAPENTVAAFRLARALGADGVELDARRSADDGVVVHHDATARGVGLVAASLLAALRAADPELATLDEALDAGAGGLVNVELKNLPGEPDYDPDDRLAVLVAATLDRRGHRDDVLVSSFNLGILDRYRTLDPATPTGWLTVWNFDLDAALALVVERGHAALHPHVRGLTIRRATTVTDRAHEQGVRVHVWTVNQPARVRRLAAAGVDAVVTDVPDVALRALGR
jgi:glycerophosphoryl diester phosphodiesterase